MVCPARHSVCLPAGEAFLFVVLARRTAQLNQRRILWPYFQTVKLFASLPSKNMRQHQLEVRIGKILGSKCSIYVIRKEVRELNAVRKLAGREEGIFNDMVESDVLVSCAPKKRMLHCSGPIKLLACSPSSFYVPLLKFSSALNSALICFGRVREKFMQPWMVQALTV